MSTCTDRDLRHITAAAKRYRDAKGFRKAEFAELPFRLGLLATEINELADAIDSWQRAFDPRGRVAGLDARRAVRLECADVVMLTATMLDDVWPEEWACRTRYLCGESIQRDAERVVRPLRKHWEQAFRAWSKRNEHDAMIALELLLVAAVDLQGRLTATPLVVDVEAKIDSMRARPVSHGRDPRC